MLLALRELWGTHGFESEHEDKEKKDGKSKKDKKDKHFRRVSI